jgi:hypothetical protein
MRDGIELGLTLGQNLGVHVDVLHIQSDPKDTIPLLGEGMSVSMIEDMIQIAETESEKRALDGQKIFDQVVSKLSLNIGDNPKSSKASAMWCMEIGRSDEITARRGRLSDLIVVKRPSSNSDIMETLNLNTALFDTGRPVLVTQPLGTDLALNSILIGCHVGIYWNGSPQSARAISSAMDLIKKAKKSNNTHC